MGTKMNCSDCGTKLDRLKDSLAWTSHYYCEKCNLKVVVSHGDAMGGSTDHIHVHRYKQKLKDS